MTNTNRALKGYNGHVSYNAWQVALWINNDEGLYQLARATVRKSKNLQQAAESFLQTLEDIGITKTPDGAPYGKTNIRLALADL